MVSILLWQMHTLSNCLGKNTNRTRQLETNQSACQFVLQRPATLLQQLNLLLRDGFIQYEYLMALVFFLFFGWRKIRRQWNLVAKDLK